MGVPETDGLALGRVTSTYHLMSSQLRSATSRCLAGDFTVRASKVHMYGESQMYAITCPDCAEAGLSPTLFSDDAIGLIHNASRGHPRAIDSLALHALTAAFAADHAIVDEKAARIAIAEIAAD